MCYLPIHAAMISFLFQFAEYISSSKPKVCEEFARFLIQRHLARREECQELVSLKDLKGTMSMLHSSRFFVFLPMR